MEGGVQVELRACDRSSAEKEAEAEEAAGRSERGFTADFCSQLTGGSSTCMIPPQQLQNSIGGQFVFAHQAFRSKTASLGVLGLSCYQKTVKACSSGILFT